MAVKRQWDPQDSFAFIQAGMRPMAEKPYDYPRTFESQLHLRHLIPSRFIGGIISQLGLQKYQ